MTKEVKINLGRIENDIFSLNKDRGFFKEEVQKLCSKCVIKEGLGGYCKIEDSARNGSPDSANHCSKLQGAMANKLSKLGIFDSSIKKFL